MPCLLARERRNPLGQCGLAGQGVRQQALRLSPSYWFLLLVDPAADHTQLPAPACGRGLPGAAGGRGGRPGGAQPAGPPPSPAPAVRQHVPRLPCRRPRPSPPPHPAPVVHQMRNRRCVLLLVSRQRHATALLRETTQHGICCPGGSTWIAAEYQFSSPAGRQGSGAAHPPAARRQRRAAPSAAGPLQRTSAVSSAPPAVRTADARDIQLDNLW